MFINFILEAFLNYVYVIVVFILILQLRKQR